MEYVNAGEAEVVVEVDIEDMEIGPNADNGATHNNARFEVIEETNDDNTTSNSQADDGENFQDQLQFENEEMVAGTGASEAIAQPQLNFTESENWETEIVDSDEEDELAACFDSVTMKNTMKLPAKVTKPPISSWEVLGEKMLRHSERRNKLALERRSTPAVPDEDHEDPRPGPMRALEKIQERKKLQRKQNRRYGEN